MRQSQTVSRLAAVFLRAFVLATGVLPGFFLVFNAVFSDGGGPGERVLSFVLIAVGYALLGGVSGALLRTWRAGLWLSTAAVVLIALYSVREHDRLLLHAAVVAVAVAAACGGAFAGARVRGRA
jgi:hypothetical protein